MALNLNYNYLKQAEKPDVFLSYPSRDKIIGCLKNCEDLITDLYFNNISEASFKYYKYYDGEKDDLYDLIENNMYVMIVGVEWFQIVSVKEYNDGAMCYKEVSCKSAENELCLKNITSFGQLGVETDEQGGLDRYALYDIMDREHSIMHIVINECRSWSIGYIDPKITTQRRQIDVDKIDTYSLLTDKCANIFKCVFIFNTFEKTISAYSLDSLQDMTGIYLSYRNLIKDTDFTCNLSDIKTVLYVSGGDYQGKGNLNIIACNPTGNNYVSNFEYFYKMMTPSLVENLKRYSKAYETVSKSYEEQLEYLKELERKLTYKKNNVHDLSDDGKYDVYSLVELQEEYDKYEQLLSFYNGKTDEFSSKLREQYYNTLYGVHNNDCSSINYNLNAIKVEIYNLEKEIENYKNVIKSGVIKLEDYLTDEELEQLDMFKFEDTFSDSSYVATDIMSDEEILEMKEQLMADARKELKTISQPSYTLTVNLANFLQMPEFYEFSKQLQLGCLITVDFDELYQGNHYIQSRLLKAHIEWDNPDNFQLEFSSKNKLDGKFAFEEIVQQAKSSYSSIDTNRTGYNNAKNQTSTVKEFMNSSFNASINHLKSNDDNEISINGSGIRVRKWLPDRNTYSDNQTWITPNGIFLSNDSFRTCNTVLGQLITPSGKTMYGLNTEVLMGKMTLSEYLLIENTDQSMAFSEDGLKITNGTNTLIVNTNNEDQFFKISKNGSNKIYFDTNGNAHFEGTVEATTIKASEMISGRLYSENWVTSGGTYDGSRLGTEGTFVNLYDGTFHFGGDYLSLSQDYLMCKRKGSYSWMGTTYATNEFYTKISEGYIQLKHGAMKYDLNITPTGISTTFNANPNNSAGIIDFYSSEYGGKFQGMTLQTNGSPLSLRSRSASILIHPSCAVDDDVFSFRKYDKYSIIGYGSFKDKNGEITFNTRCGIKFGIDTSGKEGVSIVKNTSELGIFRCGELYATSIRVNGSKILTSSDLYTDNINASLYSTSNGKGYYIKFGNGGQGATTGWCAATFAYKSTSDKRLKENINALSDMTDIYMQLKPFSYQYSSPYEDNKIRYGLLAQDIIETLDGNNINFADQDLIEIVKNTNDFENEKCKEGTHYRINYENLHALHIQQIQKLTKENKELKKENELLKKRIERIEELLCLNAEIDC